MKPYIINATQDDFEQICHLFEAAIHFIKKNNYIGWSNYDETFIQSDISNGLLFKMMVGGDIVCIFSICYSDALIWREKEKGNALYLHRIVLNQTFKGEKIVQQILDWSIEFAQERGLQYIRMDTWANNGKLIGYYKSYGFAFIENYTTPNTDNLPVQHRNLTVALLELAIQPQLTANYCKMDKVNIPQALSTINQYWTQKIIGEANGQLIKLAKGIGEINWHKHDDQDELFILHKGHLTIQLRDATIELYKDDMFIVPKGIEHCPVAHGEVELLIMGLNITSNAAGGRPDNWSYEPKPTSN